MSHLLLEQNNVAVSEGIFELPVSRAASTRLLTMGDIRDTGRGIVWIVSGEVLTPWWKLTNRWEMKPVGLWVDWEQSVPA